MSDERGTSIGWVIIVPAVLEAAFVLLWIGSFAADARLTSAQISWYVELPLIFLAVPALALIANLYFMRNGTSDRSCLVAGIMWPLLGINLIGFVSYLAVSGGGV